MVNGSLYVVIHLTIWMLELLVHNLDSLLVMEVCLYVLCKMFLDFIFCSTSAISGTISGYPLPNNITRALEENFNCTGDEKTLQSCLISQNENRVDSCNLAHIHCPGESQRMQQQLLILCIL